MKQKAHTTLTTITPLESSMRVQLSSTLRSGVTPLTDRQATTHTHQPPASRSPGHRPFIHPPHNTCMQHSRMSRSRPWPSWSRSMASQQEWEGIGGGREGWLAGVRVGLAALPEHDLPQRDDVDEREALNGQLRVHRHVGAAVVREQHPQQQRARQAHLQQADHRQTDSRPRPVRAAVGG